MANNQHVRLLPVDPILATTNLEMYGSRQVNLSPLDLLRFYHLEREFYWKLVHQFGQDPDRMKWVMSLWLWFESIGHHDFISGVSSCTSEEKVFGLIEEAIICLEFLDGHVDPSRGWELPLTCSLTTKPIDLDYFILHRSIAVSKVNHFYKKVAMVLFNNRVIEEALRDADHPSSRLRAMSGDLLQIMPFRESTSRQRVVVTTEGQATTVLGRLSEPVGTTLVEDVGLAMPVLERSFTPFVAAPTAEGEPSIPVVERSVVPLMAMGAVVQSRLNPMAEPWSPVMNPSSEDHRSMFITFSRGYPLTKDEIIDFFNTRYGNCVEMVMIEKSNNGLPPMYGRVVFTNASIIAAILNGHQTAKFKIKGKHLWARIYVPRNV